MSHITMKVIRDIISRSDHWMKHEHTGPLWMLPELVIQLGVVAEIASRLRRHKEHPELVHDERLALIEDLIETAAICLGWVEVLHRQLKAEQEKNRD